uniref:Zinc finger E-box binding homeobox 2 n=1 Tax=Rousettus aegyptiacus TaxID=9407 RepID=A0A7J8JQS5_ROUAE|nr:zinc finger E-box binding homeobox 2 [Rousettus aegyptiacus]
MRVTYVTRHSRKAVPFCDINTNTQEKDHISVRFVRKRLNTSTTLSSTRGFTQARSPISVINVASASHTRAHTRST